MTESSRRLLAALTPDKQYLVKIRNTETGHFLYFWFSPYLVTEQTTEHQKSTCPVTEHRFLCRSFPLLDSRLEFAFPFRWRSRAHCLPDALPDTRERWMSIVMVQWHRGRAYKRLRWDDHQDVDEGGIEQEIRCSRYTATTLASHQPINGARALCEDHISKRYPPL